MRGMVLFAFSTLHKHQLSDAYDGQCAMRFENYLWQMMQHEQVGWSSSTLHCI